MTSFTSNEKYLSQIPALQELIALRYKYLSPKQALKLRSGETSDVLLESVLREQLQKFNRIHYKDKEYYFSEANIQEAIQKLKNVKYDGKQKTNEAIYDLITLGTTLEQTLEGNSKSFHLNYIDWKNSDNNVFHVTAEFIVERNHSTETVRPDIVLFVNGIPLGVIECKSPDIEIEQAVSQNIRNQGDEYIPKLFNYVQLVIGVNKNAALYATAGTEKKFWSIWHEREDNEDDVKSLVNTPLNNQEKDILFTGNFVSARTSFEEQEKAGKRMVTEQDKAIYNLCRPERLLEMTHRFILFDKGVKKIARYQQFFVVRSTMARIMRRDEGGNRTGGVIWHTQGSGKSLTMVMLTRALALNTKITSPRIVLVTDRDDLDKQLGNTFSACGLSKERATSGRNLVKNLKEKVGIITTVIHKFDKGWASERYIDESPDIFVLVDESHRSNMDTLYNAMKRMLPNACYLGFSGTPLLKKRKVKGQEKNTFSQFGSLIEPHYSIKQAVKDKAILPLLYEGRHVEMLQDQATIDLWFERHTSDLNQAQQADLKEKYAQARMLNKSEQVIYMRALDISEHYRANWQGRTPFKAQLVVPSKAAALQYHKDFKAIGMVTSEVIISPPDTREGHEEVDGGPTDAVGKFWNKMLKRFGSENEYNKQLINQFKEDDEPEILIVVDKLLTGFDAPRNTVLYLCRPLREHTLLQAIARVNRLYKGKDFGYIVDYISVLGELDEALTMYEALEGFDEEDLTDTLTPVNEEVQKLPQKHFALWNMFREVKNKYDHETFEVLLADDELREDFYERLSEYNKTLGIARSTNKFLMETSDEKLQIYKRDLINFHKLKKSVQLRYAEAIDYRDHEPKIQKLLDIHVQANEVIQLNEPVDILNEQYFNAVKESQGIHSGRSTAARAETIAHATKNSIDKNIEQDPAFYEKFSKLIQQAIDDFKARRISDLDYLNTVSDIRNKVVLKHRDDVPEYLNGNDEVCAYYGVIKPYFMENSVENDQIETASAETSLAIQRIINEHWKVDFWTDDVAQKAAINDIDDFLYDEVKSKLNMTLSSEQMDKIIEKTMQIAESRRGSDGDG